MRSSDRSTIDELRAFLTSTVPSPARHSRRAWRRLAIAVGALLVLLCSARSILAWHSGRGAVDLTPARAIAILRDSGHAPEQHRAAVEALRQHAAQAADVLAEFARGAENAMVRQHAKNAVKDVAARLR